MLLHRAPLLLLGVVLGSFVLGTLCASPSHSLSYFYLQLSEPTQGQNQFFIRGYLDDQPIIRFDSLTRKTEPLVPWVEEVEKEMFLAPEWVFRDDLDKLSKLDYHAGGRHTWQVNLGCELREDGSKRGFLHYGYDGMDFISFDKETLTWVTAQPQAEKVKEKWEEDPRWSHGNKIFLEKTCIESLQRHLSYQKKVLQRIEPPVGKVTHKVVDGSLEVLVCQAFGFYPKEIQATWRRDGEVYQYETLLRNVAPNSDGTYYVQLSIEIDPKERNRFRCYLEHEGLLEPLVLALKGETGRIWWISLGIVIVMILILFLISVFHSTLFKFGYCSLCKQITGLHGQNTVVAQEEPLQTLTDSESEGSYELALEHLEDSGQGSDSKQEPERLVGHQEAPEALSSSESQRELVPPEARSSSESQRELVLDAK